MQLENTEDFYPLSPLQEGLLFHALYSPEGGEYISQISCTLRGDLKVTAFKQSLQRVVQRHAALRTFFVWEGLKQPVQVVQKHLDLTWDDRDWRGLSRAIQGEQLTAYLVEEQTRGFDLSLAPLMRLALIRMREDEYQFVWTHHHILLDGWSSTLVNRDIISFYGALSRGDELRLPKPRPYRDYIAWLQQQDLARAEVYWREALKGFTTATPLIPNNVPAPTQEQKRAYTACHIRLSTDQTARLQDAARKHRLTLNTLVQGAWGLVLSRYSGQQDVVFGATVSGRPPELEGVEEMVGVFINTLPVRVRVAAEMTVADWLSQLQKEQLESRQYEYSPLSRVQAWSEVKRGSPLFQSIVVFENFPATTSSPAAANQGGPGKWDVSYLVLVKESYPLTLAAEPGAQLLLEIKYDSSLFDAPTIRDMSKHLETLITSVFSQSNVWQQKLGEVLKRTQTEQQDHEVRVVKEVRTEMLKKVKRKIVVA